MENNIAIMIATVILSPVFGIVSALIVFSYRYGKMTEVLKNVSNNYVGLSKRFTNLEDEFYNLVHQDWITIDQAEKKHSQMAEIFCKKVEEVNRKLEIMEANRENAKEAIAERWLRVFNTLGSMEAKIENLSKRNE